MTKSQLDGRNVLRRTPALGNERLATDIVVEQVERLVDQLLLAHEILPARQTLADRRERRPAAAAGVVEHNLQVLDAPADLSHGVRALVGIRIERVERRPHTLRNLADLRQQRLTVPEHDKHVLAVFHAGRGVDEGLGDVHLV
jgi:hypothetical protein